MRAATCAAPQMRNDSGSSVEKMPPVDDRLSRSAATSSQSCGSESTLNASRCSASAAFVAFWKLLASLKWAGSMALCVPISPSMARSTRSGGLACSTLERMLSSSCRLADCILAITCSIVGVVRLTERRTLATRIEPSTARSMTSTPVRGEKSSSCSCGYCEIQLRLAPRSIMPICISKMTPFWRAYATATPLSSVVDMNPSSMPPRGPERSSPASPGGSARPEIPRYTFVAAVILPSLTIAELMTCSVVTYPFPRLSMLYCETDRGSPALARRAVLYFINIGPVYRRVPISSTSWSGCAPAASSRTFLSRHASSNALSEMGCRYCRTLPDTPAAYFSTGQSVPGGSTCARPASGSYTKNHSQSEHVQIE
mmetsp:Transcript_28892/g.85989  ORF Transcript_28892/g.85989 Transcript_28892/m.85989 type:complete len:370 (-) Transcript_28892:1328-2437(-)